MPLDRGPRPQNGLYDPRAHVFVLLPGFCMISLAGALEVLDTRNDLLGYRAARWSLHSLDGGPVASAGGLWLDVAGPLPCATGADCIVVAGGDDAGTAGLDGLDRLKPWLRRAAAAGQRIAALHSGSHCLALAGLLRNRRATVHWQQRNAFRRTFPDVDLRPVSYTMHDGMMTASGGTTAIDLFLHLTELDHGPDIARNLAARLDYHPARTYHETSPDMMASRDPVPNATVARAVGMMAGHPGSQPDTAAIASALGISVRQLERLFRRHLGQSPRRFHIRLRLDRAHRLLCFTDQPLAAIAAACGFASPEQFARQFRALFGLSPARLRLDGTCITATTPRKPHLTGVAPCPRC